MTRYEFAAGVNACLERVNELIRTDTSELASKEDIAALQRLQQEFAAELTTLRSRVDTLEVQSDKLEANQFSTTNKLEGEVVIALTNVIKGKTVNSEDIENNTTLGARTRLNFETSFTGQDLLTTRIQANNTVNPNIATAEGSFSFRQSDASTDAVIDFAFLSVPPW
jgi:hypothetical protein